MKIKIIIKQTPQRLTLKCYPLLFWMLSGLLITVGFIQNLSLSDQTLTCDRTTQRCELEHSTALSITSDSFALSSLEEANVDISAHADGETYRVILHTSEGTLLLDRYSQPSQGQSKKIANQHAQAINAFINNPNQASLLVHQSDHWFGWLMGGYFVLAGSSITVCFGTIVTWNFDKQTQQFTLKRQGLLGAETIQYPLHFVQSCMVERWFGWEEGYGNTYRVSLMLKSGKVILLTTDYNFNYQSHVAVQTAIQSFLQLSTDSASPSTASSPLSTTLPKAQLSPPAHGQDSPIESNDVFESLTLDPEIFKDMLVGGGEKREAAIADYRRQVALQPENTALYFHLAFILKMQQQNQEAARLLESARTHFLQDGHYAKAHQMAQAMQTLGLTSKTLRQ